MNRLLSFFFVCFLASIARADTLVYQEGFDTDRTTGVISDKLVVVTAGAGTVTQSTLSRLQLLQAGVGGDVVAYDTVATRVDSSNISMGDGDSISYVWEFGDAASSGNTSIYLEYGVPETMPVPNANGFNSGFIWAPSVSPITLYYFYDGAQVQGVTISGLTALKANLLKTAKVVVQRNSATEYLHTVVTTRSTDLSMETGTALTLGYVPGGFVFDTASMMGASAISSTALEPVFCDTWASSRLPPAVAQAAQAAPAADPRRRAGRGLAAHLSGNGAYDISNGGSQ